MGSDISGVLVTSLFLGATFVNLPTFQPSQNLSPLGFLPNFMLGSLPHFGGRVLSLSWVEVLPESCFHLSWILLLFS